MEKAKKRFAIGALAQMVYQAKIIGGTKVEVQNLRRTAKLATGCTVVGACTTTKLALACGQDQDPPSRLIREQAKERVKMWENNMWRMRKQIVEVWRSLVKGKSKHPPSAA